MDKNGTFFSDGLVTLKNGFDTHPYIIGSGDHINSNHSMQSFYQFIYLLLRNYKNISKNINIHPNVSKLIDPDSIFVIIKHKTFFNKYVELGEYKVELISLNYVNKTNDIYNRLHVEYILKIELKLIQSSLDCVVTELFVAPLYNHSKL